MGPSPLGAQAFDQKSALIYFLFNVPLSAFATMLLHLRFPLNAAWSCFEKNLYFNLLTPKAGDGGGGSVCWGNICYHVAAFVNPFHLICNMTMF